MEWLSSLLIAWIETEGSITLEVRHNCIYPCVQVAQKDRDPLEKLRSFLGFGEIVRGGSNWILKFRKAKDLRQLFRLLEKAPKEAWLTKNHNKWLKLKELWAWKQRRPRGHRYSKEEVAYLNELIKKIAPNSTKEVEFKTRRKLRRDLIEEIIRLREQGKTFQEISDALGIPKTTVFRYYKWNIGKKQEFKDRKYIGL